jgi:acyl-CoA thioesterase
MRCLANNSRGGSVVSETADPSHPFDQAMALEPLGGGRFKGRTSDAYWNFTGPFGGTTAAVLLNAAMLHEKRIGTPLALTANYCAPLAKGEFEIAVRELRTNRSTQHFSIELTQGGAGTTAFATCVFAERRPGFAHQPARVPEAPPPETVAPLPMRGMMEWLERYEFRFTHNAPQPPLPQPAAEPRDALTHVWVNDKPARALDFPSLAAIADSFFGRIFHVRGAFAPIGTVSMTTYFHADAADLAEVGTDPLLGVADASVFAKGYFDQKAELWSRAGKLIATSHQIVYFRG